MKTHLEKAKGALNEAKDASPESAAFKRLLAIADVQAQVAQAEALADIADTLSRMWANR